VGTDVARTTYRAIAIRSWSRLLFSERRLARAIDDGDARPDPATLSSRSPRPTARPASRPTATAAPRRGPPRPSPRPGCRLRSWRPRHLTSTGLEAFCRRASKPTPEPQPRWTFGGGLQRRAWICGDEPYRYARTGVGIDDIPIAFAISTLSGSESLTEFAGPGEGSRRDPIGATPATRICATSRHRGRPRHLPRRWHGDQRRRPATRHGVLFIARGGAEQANATPGVSSVPAPAGPLRLRRRASGRVP
jgi:hypothetical protein